MTDSRPSDIFKPGDLLNNTYRIESILGRGGTSEVYRARNDISKRLVAIKALKSEFAANEDYLTLMRREEEIREIRHDAVVRYSENHRTRDGLIYLVMDYIEGPSLEQLLRQGPVPAPDLLRVMRRVAQGLQAAHRRNIVHRDLSPDNIILRGGIPDEAIIIDFGIAKDTNPGAATIIGNEFAGKYGYAAPEQLSGHSDPRTDLYSLGATILAAFRGKPPDMGRNPMEVVQKKALPLETEGVPQPLKGLIDRLSDPIPDRRFASADALLAAMAAPGALANPAADDGERTVIAPRAAASAAAGAAAAAPRPAAGAGSGTPTAAAGATSGTRDGKDRAEARAGRAGAGTRALIVVLLLLVLALGGGAVAWLTGLADPYPMLSRWLGPGYPTAAPYALVIRKEGDAPPQMTGNAPSEQAKSTFEAAMQSEGGSADLTLASGAIAESWPQDVLAVLAAVQPLDEWRVTVADNRATVSGLTGSREVKSAVEAAFAPGMPGALDGTAEVVLGPLTVTAAMLEEVLAPFRTCGPLTVPDVPATGFGQGAVITVTGKLPSDEARSALSQALVAMVGDRTVHIDTETLGEALCKVEAGLPQLPSGGVRMAFGFGDRPGTDNPSGRYFLGEEPVIDMTLPAGMTSGYLTVSLVSDNGTVNHLIPRRTLADNSVASLRAGQSGEVRVPLIVPTAEALADTTRTKLGFTVAEDDLGQARLLVLHSQAPLFETMQPLGESVEGFAEALKDVAAGAGIDSLDEFTLSFNRSQ